MAIKASQTSFKDKVRGALSLGLCLQSEAAVFPPPHFHADQVLLDHPERFYDVKPVCCGSGIAWDDSLDIASEEIWEHGTAVPR